MAEVYPTLALDCVSRGAISVRLYHAYYRVPYIILRYDTEPLVQDYQNTNTKKTISVQEAVRGAAVEATTAVTDLRQGSWNSRAECHAIPALWACVPLTLTHCLVYSMT